jgi:sugar lactone lactonase YvrE
LGKDLELIIDSKSALGEGPFWDLSKKVLYWIDGLGCKIYKYDPATGNNITFNTDQYVGCAIPRKNSGLVSCMQHGIYFVDIEKKKMELISDIEQNIVNNRLNDGKCDSSGRLWFGSMSMTANQEGEEFETTGSFFNLTKDLKVSKLFSNVGISNGIAWNKNETKIFYIDSMSSSVVSFDFDLEKGFIENRKTIIAIDENTGIPDGMTIDSEGMLWIAHFGGYQVSRWNPDTGRKIDEIKIPAPNVTSCAFGGENLDELFITTAREGLEENILDKYPSSGGLFRAFLGVKGVPMYKFGG